jgi:hypothetical protein
MSFCSRSSEVVVDGGDVEIHEQAGDKAADQGRPDRYARRLGQLQHEDAEQRRGDPA